MQNDVDLQPPAHPTLGDVIRRLRAKRGWTLRK